MSRGNGVSSDAKKGKEVGFVWFGFHDVDVAFELGE